MRVLILSVTAGYGHHATAKAMVSALEKRDVEVRTLDLFKYINKFLFDTVDKGYLFYTKFAPNQFGHLYSLLEKNRFVRRNLIGTFAGEFWAKKLAKYFREFEPEAIICTHALAGLVVEELKARSIIGMPDIGIITDYTVHPFWNDCDHTSYYVLASHLLKKNPALAGISENRLLPYGIPVDSKFNRRMDKHEARRLLGVQEDLYTILIMSGSMGHGNMAKIVSGVDMLGMPLQTLCVCGNNKKIYKKITSSPNKNPRTVYGFVDNVDVMMDAADCLITKPGGLTVTEAMAKRLPMILVNPIPGQEERNTDFLLNNGVALLISKNFSIQEAVYCLFNQPERLAMIKRSIELITNPNAAELLGDFILNLMNPFKK